jgi:hypothetical protein
MHPDTEVPGKSFFGLDSLCPTGCGKMGGMKVTFETGNGGCGAQGSRKRLRLARFDAGPSLTGNRRIGNPGVTRAKASDEEEKQEEDEDTPTPRLRRDRGRLGAETHLSG